MPFSILPRPKNGFSLFEILIVVSIVALLAVLATPEVHNAQVRAKAASETENLRMIEAAKARFAVENPGVALDNVNQLGPYFPDGMVPASLWSDATYANVTDLTKTVTSSANGDPSKEPPIEPILANGFNDLAEPGFVYLQRPTPAPFDVVQPPNPTPTPSGNTYRLTLSVSPSQAGAVAGAGLYAAGIVASYSTAASSADWIWVNWTGDISGTNMAGAITMDSNKAAVANYVCGTSWVLQWGDWSDCSGCTGNQTRTGTYVSSGSCTPVAAKPADVVDTQVCNLTPGTWVLGSTTWSTCSAATCDSPGTTFPTTVYVASGACPPTDPKPADVIGAPVDCAPKLTPGDWVPSTSETVCSAATCNADGTKTVTTTYNPSGACPPATLKPADEVTTVVCTPKLDPGEWVPSTTWSDCTEATCDADGTTFPTTTYTAVGVCPPATEQPADVVGDPVVCAPKLADGGWVLGATTWSDCTEATCDAPGTTFPTTPYVASGICPPTVPKPDDVVGDPVECAPKLPPGTWVLGIPGAWTAVDCCNESRTIPYVRSGVCPPETDQPADVVDTRARLVNDAVWVISTDPLDVEITTSADGCVTTKVTPYVSSCADCNPAGEAPPPEVEVTNLPSVDGYLDWSASILIDSGEDASGCYETWQAPVMPPQCYGTPFSGDNTTRKHVGDRVDGWIEWKSNPPDPECGQAYTWAVGHEPECGGTPYEWPSPDHYEDPAVSPNKVDGWLEYGPWTQISDDGCTKTEESCQTKHEPKCGGYDPGEPKSPCDTKDTKYGTVSTWVLGEPTWSACEGATCDAPGKSTPTYSYTSSGDPCPPETDKPEDYDGDPEDCGKPLDCGGEWGPGGGGGGGGGWTRDPGGAMCGMSDGTQEPCVLGKQYEKEYRTWTQKAGGTVKKPAQTTEYRGVNKTDCPCDYKPEWVDWLEGWESGYSEQSYDGYHCVQSGSELGWGEVQEWYCIDQGYAGVGDPPPDVYERAGTWYKVWVEESKFWGEYTKYTGDQKDNGDPTGNDWTANSDTGSILAFGNGGNQGKYRTDCIMCVEAGESFTGTVPSKDECCKYKDGQSGSVWSPLLLDVDGLGYPDLLAGPEAWTISRRVVSQHAPMFDYRVFAMKGGAPGLWEWVGPKAGILVYSEGKAPVGALSGLDLFGNSSSLGKFEAGSYGNGYQPLATLDKNGDGRLGGEELSCVWVWQDRNGDAFAQPDEVKPASDFVKWLSVNPTLTPDGDAWIKEGGELLDGRVVPTWDWWSKEYRLPRFGSKEWAPELVVPKPGEAVSASNPTVYAWMMVGHPGVMGFLRFSKVGDKLYVATSGPDFPANRLMAVAEVVVEGRGEEEGVEKGVVKLTWMLNSDYSLYTEARLLPTGELRARSFVDSQPKQVWQGFPLPKDVPVPFVRQSVLQLPDDVFDAAVAAAVEAGRGFIALPYGYDGPVPSGPSVSLNELVERMKP